MTIQDQSSVPLPFPMGAHVKDEVSGFGGTVTGIAVYLGAGPRVMVTPVARDNKYEEATWFDADRLTLIAGPVPEVVL